MELIIFSFVINSLLTDNKEFLVAEDAHGSNGFNDWLMKYHGKQIRLPIRPDRSYRKSDYLDRESYDYNREYED